MLERLRPADPAVIAFTFEGRSIAAVPGDSIAAALLAAGEKIVRENPVSGVARGPFCMMGVCFECLVEVDGVKNRQACMLPVRAGMVVQKQRRPSEENISDLL